nr:unnamed protein product [Callosobruchus chinensis]
MQSRKGRLDSLVTRP